jgi:beta-glucosidase/6-phospho-beta-glucosidase/beta-galactosidase
MSNVYPHLGAFESTHIFGTGEDILGTTNHIDLWREDLSRLLQAGITSLRYSIPWHRVEARPGEYDWSWIDGPMQFMLAEGMSPILDPLHHTSFPSWLNDGFLNPEFPALYERFIDRISDRYPWVRDYTVFNEPLPTTLFCSYTGMWYPHRSSDEDFVAMSIRVAKAMCLGTEALKRKNKGIQLVHADTAEHHRAADRRTASWVEHVNARRFLILDLILGRLGEGHPLYPYMLRHGAADRDLKWFQDHPGSVSILGLDYYLHSEMEWFWNTSHDRPDIRATNQSPRGFASVAEDYVERFGLPIMLTETNIRGSVFERLSWLKFMEEQCEELVLSGQDFRGFCWYPSIDTTDWANCCTQCTRVVDPQGIWTLDSSRTTRHDSELSETYSALARGEITSADIPARPFSQELARRLRGYFPLTTGWNESVA